MNMSITGLTDTDRLDITQLVSSYAFYLDTRQIDPLMQLFVEDAVFDETRIGLALSEGAATIREMFIQSVFAVLDNMAHLVSSPVLLSRNGDEVRGACTVLFQGDVKTGGVIQATAYYDDVYVKTTGGWKLKARTVFPFCRPDFAALGVA